MNEQSIRNKQRLRFSEDSVYEAKRNFCLLGCCCFLSSILLVLCFLLFLSLTYFSSVMSLNLYEHVCLFEYRTHNNCNVWESRNEKAKQRERKRIEILYVLKEQKNKLNIYWKSMNTVFIYRNKLQSGDLYMHISTSEREREREQTKRMKK